ncbi:MAG TPA: vWA domain-containing protein, partial [Candidatus Krumholzibacterium sp.]|nr:vWA domain-containing protein [Candidatus Krumholzibacterium sp.]
MPDRLIFDFSEYHLVAGLVLSIFAFVMYRKTWPPQGRRIRTTLAVLRTLAFLSLIIFIMDPALVSTTVEEEIPILPILIDVSRSMSIEDHGAGRPRIEAASETALRIASGIDGVEIPIIPFSSSTSPEWPGTGVPAADGEGTDILKSIESVAGLHPGRTLAGIVVLSDGRSTADASLTARNFPAPVYTVGFGSDDEGIDLSLDEVIYEGTAYTGTETSIECVVRARGDFAGEIVARLIEGDRLLDSVVVDGEGPGEFHLRLRYSPRTEGE